MRMLNSTRIKDPAMRWDIWSSSQLIHLHDHYDVCDCDIMVSPGQTHLECHTGIPGPDTLRLVKLVYQIWHSDWPECLHHVTCQVVVHKKCSIRIFVRGLIFKCVRHALKGFQQNWVSLFNLIMSYVWQRILHLLAKMMKYRGSLWIL